MASAKQELTDPQVQGPRPTKDPLDRLVAIAIQVALREGLLNEPAHELDTKDRVDGKPERRRSA